MRCINGVICRTTLLPPTSNVSNLALAIFFFPLSLSLSLSLSVLLSFLRQFLDQQRFTTAIRIPPSSSALSCNSHSSAAHEIFKTPFAALTRVRVKVAGRSLEEKKRKKKKKKRRYRCWNPWNCTRSRKIYIYIYIYVYMFFFFSFSNREATLSFNFIAQRNLTVHSDDVASASGQASKDVSFAVFLIIIIQAWHCRSRGLEYYLAE